MTRQTSLIPELKVSDYRESLQFYTGVAGFHVVYDRPEHDFAMLELSTARLMIEGLSDKTRSWLTGELKEPFGRGMHLQIEVDNVLGAYQRFIELEYPIYQELEERWYRILEEEIGLNQFLVQDPDGYLLRFVEQIGRR